MSKEYEELKVAIEDVAKHNCRDAEFTALVNYPPFLESLLSQIMLVIANRCVFLDTDQSLPARMWETACCQQTIRKMLKANFKKVKAVEVRVDEWNKESSTRRFCPTNSHNTMRGIWNYKLYPY